MFFGREDEDEGEILDELLGVVDGEWKERVRARYEELVREEYERELKRTETGRRYLLDKPRTMGGGWRSGCSGARRCIYAYATVVRGTAITCGRRPRSTR